MFNFNGFSSYNNAKPTVSYRVNNPIQAADSTRGTMAKINYFMESEEEALRLDVKTDPTAVAGQAKWAGVCPGIRIADLGCGAGITTRILADAVSHSGHVCGFDIATNRIAYAENNYSGDNISYHLHDIREPLSGFGEFDLVWIRFVLEYHHSSFSEIVQNAYDCLKPGGTLCLIDLDYNCLSHFGLSPKLEETLVQLLAHMESRLDFDPYAGRKLYAALYDMGCTDIEVAMTAHHLIYGSIREPDMFNWTMKVRAAQSFFESESSYQEFYDEFVAFFEHPRRFTYTPLIMCRGNKPL